MRARARHPRETIDMTASLRELFDHASALPPARRAAWLAANCPDAELRARVEAVLAADAAGTTTPQRDPLALAEAIGTPSTTLEPGARIGPFAVDALLGEGGSATVYRAHRDLDGVRQTVALKVLRRGLHAPEARRQFDRERQALAQLQHPHIAQFIDGGVSADGQAFLALEFVDGAPITTFARERALDFRRRIALMVDVARAVASAHRSLIVHRDLKPGNIFVTTDGHAKLLDFGIAKLLAEDTTEATQTQFRAFTPAYAAPEQRHGGVITTATDVYALGIVLGELVTGQRLTEGGTSTPSSRITDDTAPGVLPAEPKLTRRLVKGDLDNILMKALEEEPERRYATAAAFADDLERLLDGRPVSAHPPSGWYRAKKFVQRHRGGVAITALLSLAVLVSLGAAVHQAGIAREEAARANAQAELARAAAERATATQDFLLDIFRSNSANQQDPETARRTTARELLDRGAARIDTALADQPAAQIEITRTLSKMYVDLGLAEEAARLARAALGLAEKQHGADSLEAADMALEVANALDQGGREADERVMLLERVGRTVDGNPQAPPIMRWQASYAMARALENRDRKRARAHAQEALELARRIGPSETVRSLMVSGSLAGIDSDPTAADALLSEALTLGETLDDFSILDRTRARVMLATAQGLLFKLGAAEENLARALADSERLNGPDHLDTRQTLMRYGVFLRASADRPRDAVPLLRRAADASLRPDTQDPFTSSPALLELGHALITLGQPTEAEREIRRALEMREAFRPGTLSTAHIRSVLALALMRQGRTREASVELDRAEALAKSLGNQPGTGSWEAATEYRINLAMAVEEYARAAALLETMQQGRLDQAAPNRLWMNGALRRARIAIELGEPADAARYLVALDSMLDQVGVREELAILEGTRLGLCGRLAERSGRTEDARRLYEHALALIVPRATAKNDAADSIQRWIDRLPGLPSATAVETARDGGLPACTQGP
jgi:serine/threonine-protein kinase